MSAVPDAGQLQALLTLSEALRARQWHENQALRAAPSQLFMPKSDTPEGRQLERDAFAKGLHLAARTPPPKG